jgi:hypothetical protein
VHLTFVAINEKINDFVSFFNTYKKCGFTAPPVYTHTHTQIDKGKGKAIPIASRGGP